MAVRNSANQVIVVEIPSSISSFTATLMDPSTPLTNEEKVIKSSDMEDELQYLLRFKLTLIMLDFYLTCFLIGLFYFNYHESLEPTKSIDSDNISSPNAHNSIQQLRGNRMAWLCLFD
ncbi:hypothetical protein BJ875DRAFT_488666 [Amylocarpus encephaloides]|uniref:Uncharacterized protein n=1 Tax=Amylocarpus encephaloides TaxID=45428 RepID=A0A9P7Y9M3_9HELO|nr:hypothetical protein BJ875DRAFT_488666 [Amylocarpus encephaloides]